MLEDILAKEKPTADKIINKHIYTGRRVPDILHRSGAYICTRMNEYAPVQRKSEIMKLVEIVREYRSKLPMCPSANENADIKKIIAEFINNDFYEKDYNTLTKVLITDDVTYEDTISVLKEIAVQLFD